METLEFPILNRYTERLNVLLPPLGTGINQVLNLQHSNISSQFAPVLTEKSCLKLCNSLKTKKQKGGSAVKEEQ